MLLAAGELDRLPRPAAADEVVARVAVPYT
jgi:hypothetical protein